MNNGPSSSQPSPANSPDQESFVPRGAWAFFVLLLIVGLAIWLAVYFVMVNRT